MDKLIIRHGTDVDRLRLKDVDDSARSTLRKAYVTGPAAAAAKEQLPATTLIVAELDGQIVGRCEYYVKDDRLCFMSLGVHEDYRRRGVFRRLFEYLEAKASELGCRAISCWTVEATGNVEVFRRLGMQTMSRSKSELFVSPAGGDVFEIYMEKLCGRGRSS